MNGEYILWAIIAVGSLGILMVIYLMFPKEINNFVRGWFHRKVKHGHK